MIRLAPGRASILEKGPIDHRCAHTPRCLCVPVYAVVVARARSPCSRYDLSPTSHIVEVDSTPTPTLESFLAITRRKRDGEVLRIKYVDLDGRPRMTTVKIDLKYWPTFLLQRQASGEWERQEL